VIVTAGDLINGCLRLIGQLAEDEEPSAATSQDCLLALNQMFESWSADRLSVFCTQDQVFTWPVGEIRQTLGPTGDFVGERPTLLDFSTYYTNAGGKQSFTPSFINQEQYNAITLKSATSTLPQVIFVNMTYPDIEINIFPKPTQSLIWHFVSTKPLSGAAEIGTQLSFPPGYLRAARFNLACEISSEFGVEPSKTVSKIAAKSLNTLKKINNPDDVLFFPRSLVSTRWGYNIYTGLQ